MIVFAKKLIASLVFMSFGLFICTRYRLDKAKHAQVLAALEGRGEPESVLEALL